MASVDELFQQIAQLPAAEAAALAHRILDSVGEATIAPGIAAAPDVCGGDPRISNTRIPVWTLEQLRRLGSSDRELLEFYPNLRAEDLVHAWAYVEQHGAEIERQIQENEED